MKIVPVSGPTIKGIDIYHGNNVDDFQAIKRQGYDFVFHKVSEGSNVVDHKFHQRWEAIKAAGLARGAYHFFHPRQDPLAQAKLFVSLLKPVYEVGDKVALDWEVTDNEDAHVDALRGLAFAQHVKEILGHPVNFIYGSPYFLDALRLNLTGQENLHLWVAEYGVHAPKVPQGWSTWSMWQTGENGIDHDVFQGTLEQFKAL